MLKFKSSVLKESDYIKYIPKVKKIHQAMESLESEGSDYLGWLDFASKTSEEEIKCIEDLAQEIRKKAQLIVVVGIGGSSLGAQAILGALDKNFEKDQPQIIFAGNSLSASYLEELLAYLEDKDFYVNVISKSGRTLETALAFRFLKELLIKKHGANYGDYLVVTTDASSGALREQVEKEGLRSLSIPRDIGGRYSVMTPVGLLPIALAGFDIRAFINGFIKGEEDFSYEDLGDNPAYQYALSRYKLYKSGKYLEILVTYEPALHYLAAWHQQLFGESQGKEGGGIFPLAVSNTRDLHSLGQLIQEGERNFFESVLDMKKKSKINVPILDIDDGLAYLENKKVAHINDLAQQATLLAHEEAGVDNLVIELEDYCEKSLGYLMYFMMRASAMGAYLQGVNPFDQPGVEAYKKNMLALMGQPGLEKEKADLEKLLEKRL